MSALGSDTTAIASQEVIFRILSVDGCLEKVLGEFATILQACWAPATMSEEEFKKSYNVA
jgi:hypothetical protein